MENEKSVLHILVGNIASGKSTLAQKITRNEDVIIDLDNLGLFFKDQHDLEDEINRLYFKAIENQLNIVIDGNLMSVDDRKRYIEFAKKNDYWIVCYDFGPGEPLQLEYRIQNNTEYSKETWTESFYTKQSKYQKPSKKELIDVIIKQNATHF